MAQFVQYKKMTKQTYKSIKCDFGGSKMPFTKYNVKMKKKEEISTFDADGTSMLFCMPEKAGNPLLFG